MMENKRRFSGRLSGFVFRVLIAPLVFAAAPLCLYAEVAAAQITSATGGAFSVTRGSTELSFSSAGRTSLNLFSGDIVKTSRGTSLAFRASSGAVVQLAENSSFFLRGSDSAGAFQGELFYGRARVVSPQDAAPSAVTVSTLSVRAAAGSDFACDILYAPAADGAFSGFHAVSCFAGTVTVLRGGEGSGSPSPVVINAGEIISEGIPADSPSDAIVSIGVIDSEKTDVLEFWNLSWPFQTEVAEAESAAEEEAAPVAAVAVPAVAASAAVASAATEPAVAAAPAVPSVPAVTAEQTAEPPAVSQPAAAESAAPQPEPSPAASRTAAAESAAAQERANEPAVSDSSAEEPRPAQTAESADREKSLQERVLPEQSGGKEKRRLSKQTLRNAAGVMFFAGFALTGVTMYCHLNDAAPDAAVRALGIGSCVLMGGSLVPGVMSLFFE